MCGLALVLVDMDSRRKVLSHCYNSGRLACTALVSLIICTGSVFRWPMSSKL